MEKFILQKNTNGTFAIVPNEDFFIKTSFAGKLIHRKEIPDFFKRNEDPGLCQTIYILQNTPVDEINKIFKEIPEEFYAAETMRVLPSSVSNELITGNEDFYFYGSDNNLKTTKTIYAITGKEVQNIIMDHTYFDDTLIDFFSFTSLSRLIEKNIIKKDVIIAAPVKGNKDDFLNKLKLFKINNEVCF